MSFFTQKLRIFAVVAVGSIALLLGSCFPPAMSKTPLGPLADEATHAPELIGIWEQTRSCGDGDGAAVLVFRPDGTGFVKFETENYGIMELGWKWSSDGTVLYRKDGADVWGDYVISEDALRIKEVNGCTKEFKLGTRDITREIKWKSR